MKKSFAFDYRCILAVLCTLICVVVTAAEIWNAEKTGDLLSAVTIGGALTLVFAFSLITLPKLYVADEEGLSIYYLPFVKEYFRWDEIKRIKLNKHYSSRSNFLFDFFFSEYEIVPVKEKRYRGDKYHSIFHSSEISRTALSRRMIKKYWDGEIEDETFSWLRKLFKKEQGEAVKYDLTEVKQKEKQARESLKRIAGLYESKAALHGKTIEACMTYFTDEDDFNSRPKENYSFKAEIFIEKENDEDSSFYINVEILFVSYGKKRIMISENKNAVAEIEGLINEVIEK